MKNFPKISIVIPSYNKGEYISDTLDSILSQKYPSLEVIVQDGGSTDGTVDIIKKHARKYPNIIKWESKKDKGQADAINKGLEKASGKIIAYINADDVYEKGALKTVGEYFIKNPKALWVAGKGRVINEEEKEISKLVTIYKNILLAINRYPLLLTVNYFMQPSIFLSKKVYKKYGPFMGLNKIVMEYDLWLKIGQEEMPGVLGVYLSSFRITKGTISSTLYREVLDKDYQILSRHTSNPIILVFHKINNLGRIVSIFVLNRLS